MHRVNKRRLRLSSPGFVVLGADIALLADTFNFSLQEDAEEDPNRVPTKMFKQAIKDNDRGRFIFVNPKKSAYFPTLN